jgi:hypothetical protein
LFASNVPASLAKALTISNPARICSSSKIGLSALLLSRSLETSRLSLWAGQCECTDRAM